jgi:hypothetical protein
MDPVSRVIERINDYAANLLGTPVDHLIGYRCHALMPGRTRRSVLCEGGTNRAV